MKQTQEEELLNRYLLGELTEEEQARVEERLFRDDIFFEQLQALKEELVDDYVQGELSAHEREQFEKRFLASPQWREQVQFSKALAVALTGSETPSTVEAAARSASWPQVWSSSDPCPAQTVVCAWVGAACSA